LARCEFALWLSGLFPAGLPHPDHSPSKMNQAIGMPEIFRVVCPIVVQSASRAVLVRRLLRQRLLFHKLFNTPVEIACSTEEQLRGKEFFRSFDRAPAGC